MKKYFFSLIVFFTLFISTIDVSAEESLQISSANDLHKVIIENRMAQLDINGKLVLDVQMIKESLPVSNEILEEYLVDVTKLNLAVEKNLIYYDSNLEVQSFSPDEIYNNVYEEGFGTSDESLKQYTLYNPLVSKITPFAVDPGLPTINVQPIVTGNRAELEEVYDLMLTNQKYGGGNAFTGTVGWWVGMVAPGGAWDYKVVGGFYPWSKNWYATFFNGSKNVVNSAYIGNYNYGYTGHLLFNKQTLLTAGDGVSLITTFIDNAKKGLFKASLDGEDDKIPVRAGYDDAVKYE